jgi:hypothetical protein
MANSLDKMEEEALDNHSLLVTSYKGTPRSGSRFLWFVWYRKKEEIEEDYKILTKTFRTSKEEVSPFQKPLKDFGCQVGLGNLDMSTGEMRLFEPGVY